MQALIFFGMIIIANILFTPIDKKYKLRSKYHNKSNKRFRGIIAILGLTSILLGVIIFFLVDYFKVTGINKQIIENIVMIPLLFFILISYNPIGNPVGKDANDE